MSRFGLVLASMVSLFSFTTGGAHGQTSAHVLKAHVTGVIVQLQGGESLQLMTRLGAVRIDYSAAARKLAVTDLKPGLTVTAFGSYHTDVFKANTVIRAKAAMGNWLPDE